MQKASLDVPQAPLFPPPAVELVLRCGIVPASDHVQLQLELRSCTDGQLLALWSIPHATLTRSEAQLGVAIKELRKWFAEETGPFR